MQQALCMWAFDGFVRVSVSSDASLTRSSIHLDTQQVRPLDGNKTVVRVCQ